MMTTDGPSACPHEDRESLAEDYLARRLSEAQAEEFEAHYFACDACFEQVELAASLYGALRDTAQPQPATRFSPARPRPRVWAWYAAAAAIACVTLSGVWLLRTPGNAAGESPVMRGDRDGFEVTATRSGSDLVLEWPAVPGAEHYDVRISSVEGETLWEQRTAGMRSSVALDELPPGGDARELYARVEALDGLLQPLARSKVVAVLAAEAKRP